MPPPRGRIPAQDIELDYAYKTTVHGELSGLGERDEKSGIPIKSSTGGEPVLTDAGGKYTIEVEHAGEFTLSAVVHDKGLIGEKSFTPAVTAQKPVSEKLDADPIELEEAVVSFTLGLKDPSGNAITSTVYEAKDFESSSGSIVKIDSPVTVTNGRYPLKVTATKSFTVTVAAKGLFGAKESGPIDPAAAGRNYPVTVPYQYLSTLEGEVTAGGAPIAGANITVASQGSGAEERRAVVISSRTSSDGKYRITVNHQGPFKYQAEKRDYKSHPEEFSMEKNTDGKYKFTGSPQVGRDIELTVTQDLTGLSYGVESLVLAENEALTDVQLDALKPIIDAVVTYEVEPDLPKGLKFDRWSGEITGTPTEEAQRDTPGGYVGLDYTVTATGRTVAGYIGSASYTINIRVGKALPDNMGYEPAEFMQSEKIILDEELKLVENLKYTPLGLDNDDFHAELVKIKNKVICEDVKIAPDGRITLDDVTPAGMNLTYHYKVNVIGKGRYVGTKTVDFKIHTRGRGELAKSLRPWTHTCYE